jgi:hypothetical protein
MQFRSPNRTANPDDFEGRTVARYFNTAAFTVAPQFIIGNSSRKPCAVARSSKC